MNSIWAYPWDLHDVPDALAKIAATGADTVSLATSYHAGRFLQPGNPRRRVVFPEDGTVYYPPDPARWADAEIVPRAASVVADEGDWLAKVAAEQSEGRLNLSCWTVCLHNLRLGTAHPGHALRTAFGDPVPYGLCPSSPAAQAYVAGIVAEITETYRPARIELESPSFMGFDHGFHHEKDGLGLLPEDRFLLGLCFCDHCLTGAKRAGVDAIAARRLVSRLLTDAFERELPAAQFPDFTEIGLRAFDGMPALSDFLAWRCKPVTALVARCRAVAHPDTQVVLIDSAMSWWEGVDRASAAAACDGLLYCAYDTPAERVADELKAARAVIGSEATLIAGLALFHPMVRDSADFTARATAAQRHADGLTVYNFGLVPAARLDWVRMALSRG
ncbi:hypothetical protein [Flavimaricola marinus]|uniref:Alanine-rich protein n=1 Tax=Flavimaricola marinus TaxID=1819565 RepID=A0A238LIH9_9RHOB|nr:hypothetical protein [Flavimaricola marinus]SMY09422.1 hypothetical protein LOM8899_03589 [Flavimaricola marinus]